MANSIERTDPVLNNSPELGKGSQKLVYLLLVVLAAILVGLGGYIRFREKLSWLPEVCIAAGVAIGAPGILSYIYRKYMLEEIKLEVQPEQVPVSFWRPAPFAGFGTPTVGSPRADNLGRDIANASLDTPFPTRASGSGDWPSGGQ